MKKKTTNFSPEAAQRGRMKAKATEKASQADRQRRFLETYIKTGVVSKSAKAAKISVYTHYKWLKDSEEYAARFDEAKEECADQLEMEARRRAIEGVERIRFYKGKPLMIRDPKTKKLMVYVEHEYSDRLLECLLRARRPDVFGQQKQEVEINVPSIDRAIESELAKLAEKR